MELKIEKEEAAQEKRESGHKRELLRKKEDSQKRAMCEEENREEKAKCCRIWERYLVCVRIKKKEIDFSLVVRHTQELL